MMKIRACLILFCAYQVSALPAAVLSSAERLVGSSNAVLALPAADLSSAKRRVGSSNAVSVLPAAVLSSAERRVGLSIASKLDGIMRDDSIRRPGLPPVYNQNLDLELILDSSGSIGASDFRKAKDASKVVADYIDNRCPIGPYGSRVGLIEFSSPAKTHVEFSFGNHDNLWAVKDAIDNVGYDWGSSTATAKALNLARTEFLLNGLPSNPKVAWILTDGQSNTGGNPISAASLLKNMGVTVCAVAIGDNVNMAEINGIASDGCAFKLSSFSSYKEVMKFAFAHAEGNSGNNGNGDNSPSVDPDFFSRINFGRS